MSLQNHAKEISQNCFRHWLLVSQANTPSRGELTELESLSLNSQDCLFHAAKENDGWHKAYALSVLSPTLQFAEEDWHVVYSGRYLCLK